MLLYALDLFPGDLYGWRCLREECPVYAGPYPSGVEARRGAELHQSRHDGCSCPDINVTIPGDQGERFVKGVDWDCPACVDVIADADGSGERRLKPHVDHRTRMMIRLLQPEQS